MAIPKALFAIIILLGISLPLWQCAKAPERQHPLQKAVDSLMDNRHYAEAALLLPAITEHQFETRQLEAFADNTGDLATAIFELTRRADSSLMLLNAGLSRLHHINKGNSIAAATLYNHLGFYYRKAEAFTSALQAYEQCLRIFEDKRVLGPKIAYAYKNAAQIYLRRDNFSRTRQYFQLAIDRDTGSYYRAATYAQMANAFHYEGKEDSVLACYQAGLKEKNKAEERAGLQQAGSSAFAYFGKLDSAISLLRDAYLFFANSPKHTVQRIGCLRSLAAIHEKSGRFALAAEYHQKAIAEAHTLFAKPNRETAKAYCEAGDFFLRQKDRARALDCFQRAMMQVYPGFQNTDPYANPAPLQESLEAYCMVSAAGKARAMLQTNPVDTAIRRVAAQCFDLAFLTAANLRKTFGADADKQIQAQNLDSLRQLAVQNLWQWHQAGDPQQRVLKRLFALIDDTRAAALRDAIRNQRAFALSGVPAHLVKQEEFLRMQMADAQQAASAGGNKPGDRFLKTQTAYRQFVERLTEQYPQLARFTREETALQADELQQNLPEHTQVLQWFNAGDRYLLVSLTRQGLQAAEIPRSQELDDILQRFLGMVSDRTGLEQNPDQWYDDAHFLYRNLLEKYRDPAATALLILPDGLLGYLPFEALLTAPYRGRFAQAPYLLQQCAVYYGWSARLSATVQAQKPSQRPSLLHCAPFKDAGRDQWAVLPASRTECPPNIPLTQLDNQSADVKTFIRKSGNYSILHLSTHAEAGGEGLEPRLELYDRSLRLPEIYALRLPADLVCLSACETGAGRLVTGEGALSLARGFAYAGASRLVAGLWKVNDAATASLFQHFYQNLRQHEVAAALQQSKLDLLRDPETSDAMKSPYYWAAFTLSGADGPVPMPTVDGQWVNMALLGLLVSILLLLILFPKKNQVSKNNR